MFEVRPGPVFLPFSLSLPLCPSSTSFSLERKRAVTEKSLHSRRTDSTHSRHTDLDTRVLPSRCASGNHLTRVSLFLCFVVSKAHIDVASSKAKARGFEPARLKTRAPLRFSLARTNCLVVSFISPASRLFSRRPDGFRHDELDRNLSYRPASLAPLPRRGWLCKIWSLASLTFSFAVHAAR